MESIHREKSLAPLQEDCHTKGPSVRRLMEPSQSATSLVGLPPTASMIRGKSWERTLPVRRTAQHRKGLSPPPLIWAHLSEAAASDLLSTLPGKRWVMPRML